MSIISSDIDRAARLLREGQLVAFATETVYGLGADANNDDAVAGIFAAKGRPQFNPLIVHVPDQQAGMRLGQFNDDARLLADALWPGALTLVVPRATDCPVSLLVSAGLDSIALRVPAHAMAQELLRRANVPVAAPSANRSGRISPTMPEHVEESIGGQIDMVLDGGQCGIGIESTIIGCLDGAPVLLRPGGIAVEDIEQLLCKPVRPEVADVEHPVAPGQLISHYAPSAMVRLDVRAVDAGEALLAFGPDAPPHSGKTLNLSATGDVQEAAANLFSHLRELDATGIERIAVMPVPEHGLGLAINDRLRRAAADRTA